MKELISVIIPFYNSSKTIERCIRSILNQTYFNYEILLINDGSTDDTVEIIKEKFGSNQKIRLINKEHAGVSAARNRGLKEAVGNYIQFVDSDDYLEPQMFERMLNIMQQHNADIVVCNFIHPCIKSYTGNQTFDMTKNADRIRFAQNTFTSVLPWNKLFKREIITDQFDEELAFAEDELFVFSNVTNAKKIVCIDDVLYHYYCAPVDAPQEELSCITKFAKEEGFWKSKKTFWYMRAELMPKVQEILYKHYQPEDYKEIQFARAFDYMIWELIILYYNGADHAGLIYEMQSVFHEKNFLQSLMLRKNYGIRMKHMTDEEYNAKVIRYTKDCMNAYEDILATNKRERPYYVFLSLFILYFIEQCGKINPTDQIAETYQLMKSGKLPELEYIKNKFIQNRKELSNVI